jgi:hypothetical protein
VFSFYLSQRPELLFGREFLPNFLKSLPRVTIRARKGQLLIKIIGELRNSAVTRYFYRHPRPKDQSHPIPEIHDYLDENVIRGLLFNCGERSVSRFTHYNALL